MQVGYTPDYLFLLQTILRSDPQVFAFLLTLMETMFLLSIGAFCNGNKTVLFRFHLPVYKIFLI